MDETGASLYNESTMTLEKTDPFDVFILSSGRNEFYTYDPWMHGRAAGLHSRVIDEVYDQASLLATRPNGNMTEKGSVYTELGDGVIITKEDEYFRYEYDLLNRLKTSTALMK